ncbi:MAG: YggS family pyridoxal phosphate-dependent enzyme [Clostridiales bacterium]|jgi:pyridoxal phosphate enzyme (YggS family)|nr:YggS family pyridoxal phosphate-dependent enzyme [Clostridiales bacterium]
MEILLNYDEIKDRIERAKEKAGRKADEILLVGVSKTQPPEKLKEAFNCGINVFGENKVQELVEKYPLIDGAKWHFIGHLQKNKVKYIIDKVELIHSLDSNELAEEINKRAGKINRIMPVLIQVNIGREDTKSGVLEEEVLEFSKLLSKYPNILVSGIMAIPPVNKNDEVTRTYFKKVYNIYNEIKTYKYDNFEIKYLSMGMTGDFEIAIEQGANILRVGTGIFGKRNYNRGE